MPTDRIATARIAPDSSVKVISDRDVISGRYAAYFTDESKLQGDLPLSLSFPETIEQLSFAVRQCTRNGEGVVMSGTRSGVVGASAPSGAAHVISCERLTGILESGFDGEKNRPFLRVKAGTPLSAIQAYLEEKMPGWYYPVDPTYQHAAIGGNVSTNAGGMRSYFYGPTRDWVRALSIVLAGGDVVHARRGQYRSSNKSLHLLCETGERTFHGNEIRFPKTKHSIGPHFHEGVDLVDMFVGAEGILGAVAEVELWLAPKPPARLYFLQLFHEVDQAFDFVTAVEGQGAEILAIEFFDRASLRISQRSPAKSSSKFIQAADGPFVAGVFLDIVLPSEAALEEVAEKLAAAAVSCGASPEDSLAGTGDHDLRDFKVFRHAIPEAINLTVAEAKRSIPGLYKISTDMSVAKEHRKRIFDFYERALTERNMTHYIFGHIGDAHLHLNIVPSSEAQLSEFLGIYPDFAREAVACGGAVAGEHGIGRLKRNLMPIQFSADEIETLRGVKRFFDPAWQFGRGVLLDEPEGY